MYWPFEPFAWIPGLGRLVIRFLPHDSHAWMNLDSPARGPAFAYAFSAAVKRTRYEYELSVAGMESGLISLLCTNRTPPPAFPS